MCRCSRREHCVRFAHSHLTCAGHHPFDRSRNIEVVFQQNYCGWDNRQPQSNLKMASCWLVQSSKLLRNTFISKRCQVCLFVSQLKASFLRSVQGIVSSHSNKLNWVESRLLFSPARLQVQDYEMSVPTRGNLYDEGMKHRLNRPSNCCYSHPGCFFSQESYETCIPAVALTPIGN